MGMEAELVLLAALIIIFIASFCGLLQKIRKTYENDREMAERGTNVSTPRISLTEVYVNPAFTPAATNNDNSLNNQGVFPSAPPPYTELYSDAPPKYEDLIKEENFRVPVHPGTN